MAEKTAYEHQLMMLVAFLDSVEGFAKEAAEKLDIGIKIDRDDRGRYPSVGIRAVKTQYDSDHVISKIVNGKKVK